jgi:hypothetical protein
VQQITCNERRGSNANCDAWTRRYAGTFRLGVGPRRLDQVSTTLSNGRRSSRVEASK